MKTLMKHVGKFYNRHFVLGFSLLCVICYFGYFLLNIENDRPRHADCNGYYAYLPAWFVYQDLTFVDQVEAGYSTMHLTALKDSDGNLVRYANRYQVGVAVMQIPFYLASELVSRIFYYPESFHAASFARLNYPLNGFNPINEYMVGLGGVFYGIAGVVLLLRFLKSKFNPFVAHVTVFTLLFGTNLFAYICVQPLLTHVHSFFLVVLLLYAVEHWASVKMSWQSSLMLGVVLGFMGLVRLPNVVLGIIPLLYGVSSFAQWRTALLQRVRSLVLACIAAGVLFGLQLLMWKLMNGNILVNGYKAEGFGFIWSQPAIFQVLFGIRRGVFFWFPVLSFSVIGFFMKGPVRDFKIGIAVGCLFLLYVLSCWFQWWFGGSFGYRPLVDVLPLLALPMALFYSGVSRFPHLGKLAVYCFLLGSVFWSANLVKRTVVSELSVYGPDYQAVYDVFYENYKYLKGEL